MDETNKIHPEESEKDGQESSRRKRSQGSSRLSFSSIPYHRLTRFRRVAKAVGIFASGRKRHISRLKETAKAQKGLADVFTYSQKLSENVLEEWLDFPIESHFTLLKILILPMRWLVWTSKNLIGLDPADKTLRDRIASSINNLGTTAGLFLVIAIAALLDPPGSQLPQPPKQIYVDLFGIFMFVAGASYIGYIAFILTVFYPMLQSLRDDILFDSYERYLRRWGGYELYLFNIGLHFMIFGLIMACVILYSEWAMWVCLGCAFFFYGATILFSRECFLSLDPISAMHLGLSNDPFDRHQAEKLSAYLLHKIPNNILNSRTTSPREETTSRSPALASVTDRLLSQRRNEEGEEKKSARDGKRMSFLKLRDTDHSQSNNFNSQNNWSRFNNLETQAISSNVSVKDSISSSSARFDTKIRLEEITLPSNLADIFTTQDSYLRQYLPSDICESLYAKLSQRGFQTTEQWLDYLNQMKQELTGSCQCSRYQEFLHFLQFNNSVNKSSHRKGEENHPNLSIDEVVSLEDENEDASFPLPKTYSCYNYETLHHELCGNRRSTCWLLAVEGVISRTELSLEKVHHLIRFFKPFLK